MSTASEAAWDVPLDVAQEILEVGAREYVQLAKTLAQVSKMAYKCAAGSLYRSIVIRSKTRAQAFLETWDPVDRRPLVDGAKKVRYLTFNENSRDHRDIDPALRKRIVELCSNASSIFLNEFGTRHGSEPSPSERMIIPSGVARLGINPTYLEGFSSSSPLGPGFAAFQNITHLHLFLNINVDYWNWSWTGLRSTNSLEYLCLDIHDAGEEAYDSLVAAVSLHLPQSLKLCCILPGATRGLLSPRQPPSHPKIIVGACNVKWGGFPPKPPQWKNRVVWYGECNNRTIERNWTDECPPDWARYSHTLDRFNQ